LAKPALNEGAGTAGMVSYREFPFQLIDIIIQGSTRSHVSGDEHEISHTFEDLQTKVKPECNEPFGLVGD
jgi:hypothetical protein